MSDDDFKLLQMTSNNMSYIRFNPFVANDEIHLKKKEKKIHS